MTRFRVLTWSDSPDRRHFLGVSATALLLAAGGLPTSQHRKAVFVPVVSTLPTPVAFTRYPNVRDAFAAEIESSVS